MAGSEEYRDYLETIIREIWEKKALERGYDPELIKSYGEQLSRAIDKGYPKTETQFGIVDEMKIHSLKKNVWQFSAAKTYTQLRDMSDALVGPDGKLRSFDDFRIQTVLMTGKQLKHLRTEYQTAVSGSQMASKWVDIQKTKDIYGLLEFVAVEDDRTTALCMSLSGVIKPVDDPFWMQFYPPNHYNCRSTVKKVRKGDITPDDQIVKPDIPDIFKVNLGERGLAFPEDHAYFMGTPKQVLQEARQYFPYAMQYDILNEDNDGLTGIVRQHYRIDMNASDYARLLEIAKEKAAKENVKVDIMPTLGREQDRAQRSIIFPDAKPNKSPDLRIDKILWEEEHVTKPSRRAIKGAIEAGAAQANHIIVSIDDAIDIDFEFDKVVAIKFGDYPELQTIIFSHRGNQYRYDRKQ
ncbi:MULTISPECIES: minor capsid protein [Sphingobacterium]|uniref:minor capsid protein n=1 Tax=Sphingobacterium TaxID=28453 RepID=UPI00257D9BF3|nr:MULTISPECIES: minor capsid protein [Sphingobacterium]